jgi:hypothetical protein
MVKRSFNNVKHYRQTATRYDKLAANQLAFAPPAAVSACGPGSQ